MTPTRHTFRVTDPEAFGAAAPSGVQHRMVLRQGGLYEAWRWRAASPGLIASRGWTSLAVTHHTGTGPYAFFTFVAAGDPPSVMHGRTLLPGTLAWCRAGAEVHAQSPAGATWSNLCFPIEAVRRSWEALFDTPLPEDAATVHLVTLPPAMQARLVAGLQAALGAERHAATLVGGLLRALLQCFAASGGLDGAARRGAAYGRQVRTAEALVALADEAAGPLPLAAVCAALGVKLRTLNESSNAVLGMGAAQYLRRRRLHRVLAALREGGTSVTEAATAQGFYDLGRFAGDYRALFGFRPSETARAETARAETLRGATSLLSR